jgi:tetratricopeptide (TPR) repeat protein
MGTAVQEEGEFDRAIEYFDRAIQIRPDYGEARFNRAAIELLKGNFETGWRDYEGRSHQAIWRRNHSCPETMPRWDGASFSGKRLCVHSEQGLGDTLQFVRYLPLVKALGGTVILETSEPLLELLKPSAWVDEFVVQGTGKSKDADHDMCVPLLSLPGIFNTRLDTIPASVPYLNADAVKVNYWKKKLTTVDFKVGLVWAGNPTHKKDRSRSIGLEGFRALTNIAGVRVYGLQKGDAALQAQKMADTMEIRNFGDELNDFSDTAALIENLDLVVSVDTAVAHLAGAMGKATWVLLPFVPDWRWMLERDDSPWYPGLRLFRQPEKGNWEAVLQLLATELKAIASNPE